MSQRYPTVAEIEHPWQYLPSFLQLDVRSDLLPVFYLVCSSTDLDCAIWAPWWLLIRRLMGIATLAVVLQVGFSAFQSSADWDYRTSQIPNQY